MAGSGDFRREAQPQSALMPWNSAFEVAKRPQQPSFMEQPEQASVNLVFQSEMLFEAKRR